MSDCLECPCCGEEGAYPDANGEYYDGQLLACKCAGHVSADSESDPWINIDPDTQCPPDAKCR